MPKSISPTHTKGSPLRKRDQSLLMEDTRGKKIELTASYLEQWFARAESSLHRGKNPLSSQEIDASTPSLATQCLSHFGLQSPLDVVKFLKSPEGKTIITLIGKELAEIAAIEEHAQQDLLEHQRLQKRRLAFLLLGLIYRREARVAELNEEAVHAIEKRSKNAEKEAMRRREATASSGTPAMLDYNTLKRGLAALTEAVNAIEGLLNNKLQQVDALGKALTDVEQAIQLTTIKYTRYGQSLDTAYQEIAQFADAPVLSIETIQQRIDALAKQHEKDYEDIAQLVDNEKINEARELITISAARNLHVGALHDMLSVITGKKLLFTLGGIPTTNFDEAHFILPKTKKLVLDGGKYYLLKADQNFADLSTDDKEDCERAYLHYRPEMMSVKQLVEHNKKLEQKEHSEQKTLLSQRHNAMMIEVAFLKNQMTQLQAARANIDILLKTTAPTVQMIPTPTPKPGASRACSYSNMLPSLKKGGKHSELATEQAITWLKENMANMPNPKQVKLLVNTLSPGQPIPPELMKHMVANRSLGNAWKFPGIPDVIQHDLTPFPKPTSAPSTAPTPFPWPPKPI